MRPVIGARFTCTSNTDMKMLTCLVSPGHTSPSGTSLICTTVPSAGDRTSRWRSEPTRCGSRKKLNRNSVRKPNTIAAVHHCSSSAAAVMISAGMMKGHPSGANRIFGIWRSYAKKGLPCGSPFGFPRSNTLFLRYVGCFVRPDPGCHLILQEEFALLQRLLFEFLLDCHLRLGSELAQARFTRVMLFEPTAEFCILGAENLLNVFGTIRHPFSSFESTYTGRF